MSIKQNGGVFGRNPTFNDVTVNDLTAKNLTVSDSSYGLPVLSVTNTSTGGNSAYIDTSGFTDTRYALSVNRDSGKQALRVDGLGDVSFYNSAGTTAKLTWDASAESLNLNGNLAFESGKGIDFSATAGTGTSELLDDYEEGEFAVTLTPSTSGSIALQSGADTMLYNKVGRVVHCQGQINVSSISSAVGSSIAVNLPFAKLNTTDASEASSGPVTYYNTSAYSVLPAYVPSSATQAFNIVIDPSTLANAHIFYIQFSYTAA